MAKQFATITVEAEIKHVLERKAKRNNRSIGDELKTILQDAGMMPRSKDLAT